MELHGYKDTAPDLDVVFAALSDPTRRAILARLTRGDASVAELAEPFDISQPAISKHLRTLEKAGLVERAVKAQKRPARLKAEPLAAAVEWLEDFRKHWTSRLDALDTLLDDLQTDTSKGPANDRQPDL